MPSLALARAANASYSFSTIPVAVFVGGTSGIGRAIAQAFARDTKGNAHIILCGRNRVAAEAVIASFPKPTSSQAKHEFLQCDVALMKNVGVATSSLNSRLTKVNYLVVSSGILSTKGRDETTEGIDKKLALHYYARWKFIHDLLPLMKNAKDAGEDAKAMSVLSPGHGNKIDLDDFGLRKNFSLVNAAYAASTYSDLMIESFAEREPRASFIHIYPGIVRTPLLGTWLKLLCYPVSVEPEECAEYMLHALLYASAGAKRMDSKGDDMGMKSYYGTDEARKRLWEHTVEEVQRAAGIKA